jgi:RNA polymerase sigma-70 factor (ECF subfamily)
MARFGNSQCARYLAQRKVITRRFSLNGLIKNWQIFVQCRGDHGSREKLFELLWRQYHRRLTFFVQNMVKDNAEDLVQEIMLKVYQNLHKYKPVYSFNTWIYAISRNHCLDYLKKRKLVTVNMDNETADYITAGNYDSFESHALNKELHHTIDTILSKFNNDYRQTAFLSFFEGMKNRDIARVMEIPTGTVKSRLHKIRKNLKAGLEKYHGQ